MIRHRMQFFEGDAGGGGGGSQSILGGGAAPVAVEPVAGESSIGYINPDGSFKDNWADGLGDDYKDAVPTLSQYKSVGEVYKALHSTKQMVGAKGVIVPGADAKPEVVSAFRKAIGVPEKIEEYNIKPEKLPDGVEWNDAAAKPFIELGHKHNIPPAAMQEIVAKYAETQAGAVAIAASQLEAKYTASVTELKQEFKGEFDAKIALATKTAKYVGVDPKSEGFNDPNVVRALVKLGGLISEDKAVGASLAASDNPGKTAALDIINNKTNPHYELYWQGDPATVKRVQDGLKNG